jgi:hypothetical protein
MIKIDLNNLTQAHVDEAMPNMGECTYASPCIIGTLIPKGMRENLDRAYIGQPNVSQLVDMGLIQFPNEEQAKDAREIQEAFDEQNEDLFRELIAKYLPT